MAACFAFCTRQVEAGEAIGAQHSGIADCERIEQAVERTKLVRVGNAARYVCRIPTKIITVEFSASGLICARLLERASACAGASTVRRAFSGMVTGATTSTVKAPRPDELPPHPSVL